MKRIVAALSVVALIGCGTAQKKPDSADVPKQEPAGTGNATGSRAAKGAAGGAAIGAVGCLSLIPIGLFGGPLGLIMVPVAIACVPVGALAGAVAGGVVGAATGAANPVPRTPPESSALSLTSRSYKSIGRVEAGDVLPPGELYVAMTSITTLPENQRTGFLVVNFDAPTDSDERSYAAYIATHCDTGTATVRHSITYKERDGDGWTVKRGEHNPHINVDKPSTIFAEAIRTICEAGA